MKKFLQIFFALTIVAIMLFSASSVAFAANSFVTTGKGDKVVNFTVKVNKNQATLPETWPDASYDTTNLTELDVVLKLPKSYSETGAPVQVLMFGEGYGQYITSNHGHGTWAEQFTKAGYAVFEVDNIENRDFGIKDLGAPAKVRAVLKAFDYIKENYNVLPKFIPIGVSNGTLLALEIMDWYPEYVSCGIIGGPNVSLEESYKASDNWNTNQNSVALYYNFSNKSTYYTSSAHNRGNGQYDKTVGLKYDFYGHMYSKGGVNYLDKEIPPVLFCIGANEPVTPHRQALEVANALKNSGNTVVIKEYAGTAHGPVCSLSRDDINKDVLDFIATYKNVNCKHTNTKITPAVKATCHITGLTEGKNCADCGKVIVAQKEVAKLSHKAGAEPTCSTAQTCVNCGMTLKAQTYKHVYTDNWTKDGEYEYRKCATCDNTQRRKIGEEEITNIPSNNSSNSTTSQITSSNANTNTSSTQTHTNSSAPDNNNNAGSNSTLIAILIGVGGALLILGLIVTLYLVLKKKKK